MAETIFDIHNCYVEFVEGNNGKFRPILILDWDNTKPGYVLFYKTTTQYDNKPKHIRKWYYPIKDWKQANIYKPSYIDIFKEEALEVEVLIADKGHYRGRLTDRDIIDFTNFYSKRR